MEGTVRLALPQDAECLFAIRREAIQVLAPRGMPQEVARRWAASRTVEWMRTKIAGGRVWLFEAQDEAVGWISVTDSTIDGLYTLPSHELRGVGSRLLAFAEDHLRTSGQSEVTLQASWNAEGFYLRRGYLADGPRPAKGPRRMHKRLELDQTGIVFRSDGVVALDRFCSADAPAMREWDADPAHRLAFEFPDGFVPSLEHSQRVIDEGNRELAVGNVLTFAVRDSTSGALLGGCELHPKGPSANLSYWTHPAHRKRGVASRAVALASKVAFDDLHIERLEILTAPSNAPSRRVALRSGFKEVGLRDGQILHVLDRVDHGFDGRRD